MRELRSASQTCAILSRNSRTASMCRLRPRSSRASRTRSCAKYSPCWQPRSRRATWTRWSCVRPSMRAFSRTTRSPSCTCPPVPSVCTAYGPTRTPRCLPRWRSWATRWAHWPTRKCTRSRRGSLATRRPSSSPTLSRRSRRVSRRASPQPKRPCRTWSRRTRWLMRGPLVLRRCCAARRRSPSYSCAARATGGRISRRPLRRSRRRTARWKRRTSSRRGPTRSRRLPRSSTARWSRPCRTTWRRGSSA